MNLHFSVLKNFNFRLSLIPQLLDSENHQHLFNLADYVKDQNPQANPVELQQIVRRGHKDQLEGTLDFLGLRFRDKYLNWIYRYYSSSEENQERVHATEKFALINGAKRFNEESPFIKITDVTILDTHQNLKLQL